MISKNLIRCWRSDQIRDVRNFTWVCIIRVLLKNSNDTQALASTRYQNKYPVPGEDNDYNDYNNDFNDDDDDVVMVMLWAYGWQPPPYSWTKVASNLLSSCHQPTLGFSLIFLVWFAKGNYLVGLHPSQRHIFASFFEKDNSYFSQFWKIQGTELKFVVTAATGSCVKFLPAVYIFQESNVFLVFWIEIKYHPIYFVISHTSIVTCETVEILHIQINFNTKKDPMTYIGAFTLIYYEWK